MQKGLLTLLTFPFSVKNFYRNYYDIPIFVFIYNHYFFMRIKIPQPLSIICKNLLFCFPVLLCFNFFSLCYDLNDFFFSRSSLDCPFLGMINKFKIHLKSYYRVTNQNRHEHLFIIHELSRHKLLSIKDIKSITSPALFPNLTFASSGVSFAHFITCSIKDSFNFFLFFLSVSSLISFLF